MIHKDSTYAKCSH